MPQIKAVIFDYIGTLINARSYTLEASMNKLHRALVDEGFRTDKQQFLESYANAHEKYRLVRYGELREVTNAIWVSETLSNLGYPINPQDLRMKTALNVFFQDYVDSLELRPYAKKLLKKITETCKLGLISNFTYAPVVYSSLRKLGIAEFFNAIVVSGENGWRKPHQNIFKDTLKRLQVEANETVFIGDSPMEDIKGAMTVGFKTIFVCSQFYSIKDLNLSNQTPDFIMTDLKEIYNNLSYITDN
jgi:putative hydrolase of the HAD superfamily